MLSRSLAPRPALSNANRPSSWRTRWKILHRGQYHAHLALRHVLRSFLDRVERYRLTVGAQLLERAVHAGDGVELRIPAAEEEGLGPPFQPLGEEHAARRLAVPPGAPRLLVVRLQRARQVVVDDEADIRLVDPHAEGVGGHDHPQLAGHEAVLGPLALAGAELAVVAAEPRSRALGRYSVTSSQSFTVARVARSRSPRISPSSRARCSRFASSAGRR